MQNSSKNYTNLTKLTRLDTIKKTLFVGKEFYHFQELASTNDYAIELTSKSKPSDGTVISTYKQVQGKGQAGSKWESEPDKNISMPPLRFRESKSWRSSQGSVGKNPTTDSVGQKSARRQIQASKYSSTSTYSRLLEVQSSTLYLLNARNKEAFRGTFRGIPRNVFHH